MPEKTILVLILGIFIVLGLYYLYRRHAPGQARLAGQGQQLHDLWRYHRQTLHNLPVAVCSVDQSMIIRSWNRAMTRLTGIDGAVGSRTSALPMPWKELLNTFIYGIDTSCLRHELIQGKTMLYLNLHKAAIVNTGSQATSTESLPGEKSARENLVIVVEDLTETRQLQEQLLHKERLASIGQLAAGVAHEIGNPITGIACLAQNLKLETTDQSLVELSEQILTQTERVASILQALGSFAHGGKADAGYVPVPVTICQCVDQAIQLLSLHKLKDVELVNTCPQELQVLGNPQRLAQVFLNLLSNAQDASDEASRVIISGSLAGDEVTVLITDEGHGIPGTENSTIFEPFFTTKDPGQGTGLGLTIVASIIAEHQGRIHAEPNEQQGTRVVIHLPALRHASSG